MGDTSRPDNDVRLRDHHLEIEQGVLSVQRRDPTQGELLRAWLDGFVLPAFAGRILPIDTATARRCARLQGPDPQNERNAFIAATALEHRLTVVTRNTKDFRFEALSSLNPWTAD